MYLLIARHWTVNAFSFGLLSMRNAGLDLKRRNTQRPRNTSECMLRVQIRIYALVVHCANRFGPSHTIHEPNLRITHWGEQRGGSARASCPQQKVARQEATMRCWRRLIALPMALYSNCWVISVILHEMCTLLAHATFQTAAFCVSVWHAYYTSLGCDLVLSKKNRERIKLLMGRDNILQ